MPPVYFMPCNSMLQSNRHFDKKDWTVVFESSSAPWVILPSI